MLDEKEWLNAANLAGDIAQNEITVYKIVRQGLFYDFIEAVVLAASLKSARPIFILPQFVRRYDDSSAIFERE